MLLGRRWWVTDHTMKVAPGFVWFTYQLSPPVPYSEGELVIRDRTVSGGS
jgi:hypothetical protein